MQCNSWSKIFASCAINDEALALAYEQTSAAKRACLKNAIAFHALKGESPNFSELKQEYVTKGYWTNTEYKPVPWVLCLCFEGYSSAARLCSALMQAMLSGVPNVYFVHVGKAVQSVHLSLELLGIENAIELESNEQGYKIIKELLLELAGTNEQGRVLLLQANTENSAFIDDELQGMQYWKDELCPRIFTHNLSEPEHDLLCWAQGNAIFCNEDSPLIDAIYGYSSECTLKARQMWARHMEACFVHHNLSDNFFKNKYLTVGNFMHNEEG